MLGSEVLVPEQPERVVTLMPSLGELAADILGELFPVRIIGVSEFTDYPPALTTKESVGPYHRINIEKIVSLKPQLVLASMDGNAKDEVDHLRERGISVLVVSTRTFEEIGKSIRLIGEALGRKTEGEQLAAQLERGTHRIHERTHADRIASGKKRVLIQVGDDPLVVAGGGSFLSEAVEIVGGVNVYKDLAAAYPRPSLEDVMMRDPEVILIADLGKSQAATSKMMKRWKVFSKLKAVQAGRVQVIEGDTLLRPTLRLLEGLAILEKNL